MAKAMVSGVSGIPFHPRRGWKMDITQPCRFFSWSWTRVAFSFVLSYLHVRHGTNKTFLSLLMLQQPQIFSYSACLSWTLLFHPWRSLSSLLLPFCIENLLLATGLI
ncbi:hypothetical protein ACJX0J_025482, partial [Zea mays]